MNRIAVIVTTYNRPDALAAVLEAYLAQTDDNFEVIVADDGSTDDTRKLVETYRARADSLLAKPALAAAMRLRPCQPSDERGALHRVGGERAFAPPDETTNHSTRLPKNASQVAGYPAPDASGNAVSAGHAQFSVSHVWQEDQGFRAAAARNRALAATTADYIVFTDGDCIPLPSFVARHRLLAEPGYFLAGNRLLLSERFTQKVLREKIPVHALGMCRWLAAWMKRDINRILPLLLAPNFGMIRKLTPQRWQGVKTCNLSAWRTDLIKVNGLDETYSGWGLEDSDLAVRLIRAGVRHKSARLAAPVLHLWHRENARDRYEENHKKLNDILHSDRVQALQGVRQYL